MGHFVGSRKKSEHKVTAVVTSTHAAWMWARWYFFDSLFSKEHCMIIQEKQKLPWIFPQLHWSDTSVKMYLCTSANRLSIKTRHVCRETEIETILFFPKCLCTVTGWTHSPAWAARAWRNEVMFQHFLLPFSVIHRLPYHRCRGGYLFTYCTYTMLVWINLWICLSSTFGIVHNSTTDTTKVPSFFRLLRFQNHINQKSKVLVNNTNVNNNMSIILIFFSECKGSQRHSSKSAAI